MRPGGPARGAGGGGSRIGTVEAGGARDRVLVSRVRDRSGEGPADMEKPRAVSAGAASLMGHDGIDGKPFSRSSAEPIGTLRNYRKRQTR
jgi:hypothetical protein